MAIPKKLNKSASASVYIRGISGKLARSGRYEKDPIENKGPYRFTFRLYDDEGVGLIWGQANCVVKIVKYQQEKGLEDCELRLYDMKNFNRRII